MVSKSCKQKSVSLSGGLNSDSLNELLRDTTTIRNQVKRLAITTMYSYYSLLFVSFSLKSKNLLRVGILNYSIYIYIFSDMLSRWSSGPCLEWILLIFLFSLKCSSGGEKVIQKKLNLLSTIFVCNYGFQWRGNIFIIYMLILSCRDHFRRSRKWAEFSLSYFATLHKCVLTFF